MEPMAETVCQAKRVHCSARATSIAGSTCLLLVVSSTGHAQGTGTQSEGMAPGNAAGDPSIDYTLDAAESEGELTNRKFVHWNEYEGPYFTARLGAGFLYDYAAYDQESDSKKQIALSPKADLRDFRLLLKGRFKFAPRFSYTIGYMYDKGREQWRFRQTGLMIDVPELLGNLFIGRTKEGFSTSKIMVGYQGWTNERAAINDALIPILADGIKWMGYVPNGTFVYSLGWFGDSRAENESYNKSDRQFTARAVWLPFTRTGSESKDLLHLALEARLAASNDGFFHYRSKPESFEAQSYAIDTGKFAAEHSVTAGVEAYYRRGPLVIGSEYFFNQVASREEHDPFFHGGEIFVAYTLTGETRPYNARGAYFEKISPERSVFEGGPGAWEAVLRYSYADLDSKGIQGGKFWRLTPVLNWHLSENVRLEFVSGYGVLNRFGTQGGILFGQTRLQLQL
jgi:phosphate-selective porin OprO/OprP